MRSPSQSYNRRAQLRAIVIAGSVLLGCVAGGAGALCGELTFISHNGGSVLGTCATSSHDQSCPDPNPQCFCASSTGNISGAAGNGYAQLDVDHNYNPTGDCFPFNASIFAVGDEDVEQVDFSGSYCEVNHEQRENFEGTYQIVRSAEGRMENGKVSGVATANALVLHFIADQQEMRSQRFGDSPADSP